MLTLYTLTMFMSATLLFLIQPLFARMILPMLGGSPAVWNTAVVFYQTVLLAGYVAAHAITTRLSPRRQVILYALFLLLPFLVLPIAIPAGWMPPTSENPVGWLLALLAVAVGVPFFVVSTSSPLIQRWFSYTKHDSAHDPYFLYAASNVGSMLGLLVYPFVLERFLRLDEQSWIWTAGYIVYFILMIGCMTIVWRSVKTTAVEAQHAFVETQRTASTTPKISWLQRGRWVLWAIIPSSLMLSVTSYLSTNIASVPLFWVIPLALYLLTFVIVFAKKRILPQWIIIRAVPIFLLPTMITILVEATDPFWILFPLHLITFVVITLACHGSLALDRPAAESLTEFYMWVSIGGALGGMFTALISPVIFNDVWEYPLMLIIAAWFALVYPGRQIRNDTDEKKARNRDIVFPLALALILALFILGVQASSLGNGPIRLAIVFGIPMLLCFSFSRRPVRFGLGVAAIVIVSSLLYINMKGQVVYKERSFFGLHKVLLDEEHEQMLLVHGTTLHGVQSTDPSRECESLSYYYKTGPIGQVIEVLQKNQGVQKAAMVGLGVGSLVCYQQEGQQWTYYEIDPVVEKIARDPRFFTYLDSCASNVNVVLGDARLSLEQATDQRYDLLVLDAYSSDAIPIHLLTREALALYQQRITQQGVIAFHISNRYFNLKPVVAALGEDAGMVVLMRDDLSVTQEEREKGKEASQWVVMAHNEDDLGSIASDSRWQSLNNQPDKVLWTDDFASIFSVLDIGF